VRHSCVPKKDDGCKKMEALEETDVNVCYCNEDLCNGEWTAMKLNTAECL